MFYLKKYIVLTLSILLFSTSVWAGEPPTSSEDKKALLEKAQKSLSKNFDYMLDKPHWHLIKDGLLISAAGGMYWLYSATRRSLERADEELYKLKRGIVLGTEKVPLSNYGDEYVKAYSRKLKELQEVYLYAVPGEFYTNGGRYVLDPAAERAYLEEVQSIVKEVLKKYEPGPELLIVRGDTPEITFGRMASEVSDRVNLMARQSTTAGKTWFIFQPGVAVRLRSAIAHIGKQTLWMVPLAVFLSHGQAQAQNQEIINRLYNNVSLVLNVTPEQVESSDDVLAACVDIAYQVHEISLLSDEEAEEILAVLQQKNKLLKQDLRKRLAR